MLLSVSRLVHSFVSFATAFDCLFVEDLNLLCKFSRAMRRFCPCATS